MSEDTIVAISTPVGEGAIGIVRLSGEKSIEITNRLFSGKNLIDAASHTVHYGNLIDQETGEIAEEVLISVFKAPKTYTRENVVEINCHGGLVSVNRVLNLIVREGVRIAEPGEFTKRAFLNGRIDLSQAEAVMDVIRAKTDKAMNVALKQMDGRLSQLIQSLRQELIETVAHVEVNIDYPEYDDVEEMTNELMITKTKEVHKQVESLIEIAKQGKVLREGIKTGIIGRPNVGKSSLLNTLAQETKAIVTEIPGTTRDVIEEFVNVRGIPLQLIDTAGIRDTDDVVEQIGVERSKKVLTESDLILFVLNNNDELTDEDIAIMKDIQSLNYIILINKIDLENKLDVNRVRELTNDDNIVEMSITEDKGIDALEEMIANMFFSGVVESEDLTYVSNARHVQLLHEAKQALEDAEESIGLDMPLDIVQIDVTRAWEFLGEIIGDTASDSLIDQLFSQFCLGK
ncbi:MAG TPA: tRNA uridine-5-carboxymethylaminomethyl(34) synthesis GTPase MnmE [Bacillota bacterium]|nr:tRNA uridine-5-carboxymethylaminomethyl(34) synthesis GTPase MnmE [Bacillota bacterium]